MEGEYATNLPLSIKECALVVEECFSSRLLADILCMGNINERESYEVHEIIKRHFLTRCRPLSPEEVTKISSLQLPTKLETIKIFGRGMCSKLLVYEEMAHNRDEENNAVEIFLQTGCEHSLGYRGVAIVELIGHMGECVSELPFRSQQLPLIKLCSIAAYNSAYNQ